MNIVWTLWILERASGSPDHTLRTTVLEEPPLGVKELVPEELCDLPKVTQQVNCSVGTRLNLLPPGRRLFPVPLAGLAWAPGL